MPKIDEDLSYQDQPPDVNLYRGGAAREEIKRAGILLSDEDYVDETFDVVLHFANEDEQDKFYAIIDEFEFPNYLRWYREGADLEMVVDADDSGLLYAVFKAHNARRKRDWE